MIDVQRIGMKMKPDWDPFEPCLDSCADSYGPSYTRTLIVIFLLAALGRHLVRTVDSTSIRPDFRLANRNAVAPSRPKETSSQTRDLLPLDNALSTS